MRLYHNTGTKPQGAKDNDYPVVLKDKSGVGIIVDYSRDYTAVNGV